MKHLGKIVIGSICAVLLGLTTLLIIEYRFFHDQAQKMLELKEEYRAYTQAVKKILNEYNAMKEQAAESGDYAASERFIYCRQSRTWLPQTINDQLCAQTKS